LTAKLTIQTAPLALSLFEQPSEAIFIPGGQSLRQTIQL
jgi:hypothetical protein